MHSKISFPQLFPDQRLKVPFWYCYSRCTLIANRIYPLTINCSWSLRYFLVKESEGCMTSRQLLAEVT